MFAAVAGEGSFARAARGQGLSVATVSRAVARLEARLGGTLFHRSSRRLSLSALGAEALPEAQALVQAAEQLEERLGDSSAQPSGIVRVAAPMDFGLGHLAPLLPDFLAAHPGVHIDLHLDDAMIDIVAGGHDLVLRIGRLANSSLIARRLCEVRLLAAASPAYLAAAGTPVHPADLARHRCLCYANSRTPDVWSFEGAGGERWSATVTGPLSANNGSVLLAAMLSGAGIAILPEFLLWTALRAGQLELILPGWRPPPAALNMVTPPSPLRPARVRLLMDFLSQRLAAPPWAAG